MKSKELYRDFFLHADIFIMFVIFIVITSLLASKGLSWSMILIFGFGLITFMLSEYATHRFLFHLKAPKKPSLSEIFKAYTL